MMNFLALSKMAVDSVEGASETLTEAVTKVISTEAATTTEAVTEAVTEAASRSSEIMEALQCSVAGIIGIFLVVGIIILSIVILNKTSQKKKDEDNK